MIGTRGDSTLPLPLDKVLKMSLTRGNAVLRYFKTTKRVGKPNIVEPMVGGLPEVQDWANRLIQVNMHPAYVQVGSEELFGFVSQAGDEVIIFSLTEV